MNKGFVVKMIRAEMLRYEAVKEILPDCLRSKVDEAESDFKDTLKQLAFELIKEDTPDTKEDIKKDTRKISVDFDN